MYSGGSDFNLSEEQVRGLQAMLDAENGAAKRAFVRPETQAVGFSLSEAAPRASEVSVENNVGKVAATPGGIYVPPSVGTNNPNLPVPSGSKAAQQRVALEEKKKKPAGNSIWADDEVDGGYGSTLGAAVTPASSNAAAAASAPATAASTAAKPAASSSSAAAAASLDHREVPEYEVLYSANQTAEDVYLGADFTRDGSSAMCESLVVKVKLPKLQSIKELDLEVEAFALRLKTNDYRMRADLPAKVIEKKGAAKWDGNAKTLTVTLTTDPAERKVKMMS